MDMDMDNNNNINKYNLQNRFKWRKINFYKNIKLLDKNIWEIFNSVLFNRNNNDNDNSKINPSRLFVSCLYVYIFNFLL